MTITHVEHLDGRHRSPVDALRQAQPGHREHALRARRGAAEDEHGAGLRGAHLGDPAGVVARVTLVLVGALVLLVDDDQAKVAHRREHGRAGPDTDARLAAAQALPFVVALAHAERRVQHRHHVAKARLKSPQDLRRERDLGDQHDRRAAPLQGILDRVQVDLGLARAGHAVQQKAGTDGDVTGDRAVQRRQCALLIVGQRGRVHRSAAERPRHRPPPSHAGLDPDQPAPLQAP